jgi:hypothetical protein
VANKFEFAEGSGKKALQMVTADVSKSFKYIPIKLDGKVGTQGPHVVIVPVDVP